MSKKHIVIDARIINSSTGTYVERLLNYLQDLDTINKYTILVPIKDKNYFKPHNKNFSIKTIDIPNYSFKEQTTFRKILNSLKPDLVHFCMPQQPIFYRGKKVTTFHDLTLLKTYPSDKNKLVFKFKQFVGRFVFKSVSKKSNKIIVPTEYTRADIIRTLNTNPNKIVVTYEAADKVKSGPKEYKHPFDEYILYVGNQSDYKNIKRLGDAHQLLLKKYPKLGLILVGKLDKAAINNRDYFESKNYKNIKFTGFVSNEERDWLFENCQAYVFPSLSEGFGLPGLEAMNYNAPVISSDATCLPEVYGKAAHYFNPTLVNDIARAIDEVLSSKKLQRRLAALGQEQVKKYSWKKTAKETLAVYNEILNKK